MTHLDAVKPHLTDAPVPIVVFEQAYRVDESGEKHKRYYVRESVGIAVGFLVTALHLSGLATLTHAPSRSSSEAPRSRARARRP